MPIVQVWVQMPPAVATASVLDVGYGRLCCWEHLCFKVGSFLHFLKEKAVGRGEREWLYRSRGLLE